MMQLNESMYTRPSSLLRAIVMCADFGGLAEKEAAEAMGVDNATWSRIKSGTAGIKPDALETFMDACGNELPLYYLAARRGYELVPSQTELERQLAEEQAKTARLEQQLESLMGLLRREKL